MRKLKVLLLLFLAVLLKITIIFAQIENPDIPKYGNWDFKPKEELTVSECEGELFFQITMMKIPYEGPVYIYDYMHSKFFVFDPVSGLLLKSFGKQGQGPGEFNMVLDFFMTNEQFIVYDFGKVHFLSLDGEYNYLESKVLDNTTGTAPSLFLEKNRFLTVPRDPAHPDAPKRIEIYNMDDGDVTTIAGTPFSEVRKKSSTKRQETVISLGGGGVGSFKTIDNYIMTLKNKILYYGINDQYIINAIELNGDEMMSFSLDGRKRIKTSRAYRKVREDSLNNGQHNMPPAVVQQMISNIPQESTFFYKLHVDENGFIYVFISNIEDTNTECIDIFSPKGEYVYRSEIMAPDGYQFHSSGVHFFTNSLFCVVENEDGQLLLKKYKITPPPVK